MNVSISFKMIFENEINHISEVVPTTKHTTSNNEIGHMTLKSQTPIYNEMNNIFSQKVSRKSYSL